MDKEFALILSIMSLMAAAAAFAPAALAQDGINATVNNTTMNNTTLNAAPISDMARVDPALTATASSAQVASDPEGVFKLGEGVGGRDLFEVKESGVKTMEIGIPIKPLRDVGKMVFVCDIV